jgi:hypothetical protein
VAKPKREYRVDRRQQNHAKLRGLGERQRRRGLLLLGNALAVAENGISPRLRKNRLAAQIPHLQPSSRLPDFVVGLGCPRSAVAQIYSVPSPFAHSLTWAITTSFPRRPFWKTKRFTAEPTALRANGGDRIANQIDAALVFAWSNFVNVHFS